jgi:hypothetical protein
MTNAVQGYNPLSYQGVSAVNPPNIRTLKRPPNSTDTKNVNIGDFWLDSVGEVLYQLVNLANDIATWNTVIASNPSGATINTTGQLLLESSENSITAINIDASNAGGGIGINSGTGGVGVLTTGGIEVRSSAAAFPAIDFQAISGTGGIRFLSVSGGVVISNGTGVGTTAAQILVGLGSPNVVVSALKGSLFIRTDGTATTTLYVNTDGASAWTALT